MHPDVRRILPRQFSTSEQQDHTYSFLMLAGGQLSAQLAILKGVRAGIIEMRVATKNRSIKKNDDTARMSATPVLHLYRY